MDFWGTSGNHQYRLVNGVGQRMLNNGVGVLVKRMEC